MEPEIDCAGHIGRHPNLGLGAGHLDERAIAQAEADRIVAAARALDRVLRAGHYWVPHWYKASNNIAYWDKFSRPETKARFDRGILDTWWYDADKAAKLTPVAAKTPDTEGGIERCSMKKRMFLMLVTVAALVGVLGVVKLKQVGVPIYGRGPEIGA